MIGTDKTGLDFAHFLVDLDLDKGLMPVKFTYNVHSSNPVGRDNIIGLMDGYLRWKRDGNTTMDHEGSAPHD
jgi:hypothetical protein